MATQLELRVEAECPPLPAGPSPAATALTALIVVGPVAVLAVAIPWLWGDLVNLHDVLIGTVLYLIAGFGISVGYHRCFTHRSFRPNRPLKIALAAAGSMAVEGSLIGWVAAHRRHHRYSDRPGDPHSPNLSGAGFGAMLRGLVHAHVGWLFSDAGTPEVTYADDLRSDPELLWISSHWWLFAVGSLLAPFGLGWVITGTVAGGLTTFVWAGVARMFLLHHVTWSINSLCHVVGQRPFRSRDRSANLGALAIVSFGESYHNFHHAWPRSARHGALAHQGDPSAWLIRCFERAGWATEVHWPTPSRIAALHHGPDARSAR